MPPLAEIVNTHALLQTVWVAAAAGVGISAAFGLFLLGSVRATEARQRGSTAHVVVYGALAAVTLAIIAAGVVFGIIVMTQK